MSITIGGTYTFIEPGADAACQDTGCEVDNPDLIFPWINLLGKRVTVAETGYTYACGPAVKVAYGPVDWHPRVAIRLTEDQANTLGIPPHVDPRNVLMIGQIWSVDDGTPEGITDLDEVPWGGMSQIEMPSQRTEIVPVRCLQDPTLSRDEKRREDRLRKLAAVHNLRLKKLRGGTSAHSTGPYLLVDARHRLSAVAGDPMWRIGVSLEEIEAALNRQPERQS